MTKTSNNSKLKVGQKVFTIARGTIRAAYIREIATHNPDIHGTRGLITLFFLDTRSHGTGYYPYDLHATYADAVNYANSVAA